MKDEFSGGKTGKMWRKVKVEWRFEGNLFASVPKNPELIEPWLRARQPKEKPVAGPSIAEIRTEVAATMVDEEMIEEEMKRIALGFQSSNGSLVVRGATIKAHIKECARWISTMYITRGTGEKAFSTKIINGVYPVEYFVPIKRIGGNKLVEPDGNKEMVVHVKDRAGSRSALKSVDYVSNVELQFHLMVFRGIEESDLETVFEYGSVHGYAGERGMGEGRYEYKIG